MNGTRQPASIAILTCTRGWGGVEIHTVQLACELARRGNNVRIVQIDHDRYDGNPDLIAAGIATDRAAFGPSLRETSLRQFYSGLRAMHFDVILLPKGGLATGSFALDLAARLSSRRLVTIEHSQASPIPAPDWSRLRRGRNLSLRFGYFIQRTRGRIRSWGPHRVVCVSEAVQDTLVRHYRFAARKTRVVRNGTSFVRFAPQPGAREAIRAAWGIPPDATVVGILSRLAPEKGLVDLITIFARVCAAAPTLDLRLVFVGDGPDRVTLEAITQELRLSDRIVFAGHTDEPWNSYCGFDLFALPSLTEGLPLALLEAMATGLVTVAYDVGGIREAISEEALGWVVPPGDAASYEEALRSAVLLPTGERSRRAEVIRAHVTRHFDLDTMLNALCAEIRA